MKLKKILATIMTVVISVSMPVISIADTNFKAVTYNFTADYMQGSKKVATADYYDYDKGYGFVDKTTAMPERTVNVANIQESKKDLLLQKKI